MTPDQPPEPTAWEAAQDMVDALNAAGITATCDPRAATPPCVLITPPASDFTAFGCGRSCSWEAWVLVPATGNADAFRTLEWVTYWVRKVLPDISRSTAQAYALSPDNPPLPAYRLEFESGV